jgi:hypothetical protein
MAEPPINNKSKWSLRKNEKIWVNLPPIEIEK